MLRFLLRPCYRLRIIYTYFRRGERHKTDRLCLRLFFRIVKIYFTFRRLLFGFGFGFRLVFVFGFGFGFFFLFAGSFPARDVFGRIGFFFRRCFFFSVNGSAGTFIRHCSVIRILLFREVFLNGRTFIRVCRLFVLSCPFFLLLFLLSRTEIHPVRIET